MNQKYNVYLVSDSTGETLDRIFLSLKSQFSNFEYELSLTYLHGLTDASTNHMFLWNMEIEF